MNQKLLPIFQKEQEAIKYLILKGVKCLNMVCYKCKTKMSINFNAQMLRCNKKSYKNKTSIFKNTIFEGSKIKINIIYQITYLYLKKTPVETKMNFTGCSSRTITQCTFLIRKQCTESLQYTSQKLVVLALLLK